MKKSTKSPKTTPAVLSQLNPKCAGIDVGASELFVCIAKSSSEQEVRTFSTFTADIKFMIKWLKKNKVDSNRQNKFKKSEPNHQPMISDYYRPQGKMNYK